MTIMRTPLARPVRQLLADLGWADLPLDKLLHERGMGGGRELFIQGNVCPLVFADAVEGRIRRGIETGQLVGPTRVKALRRQRVVQQFARLLDGAQQLFLHLEVTPEKVAEGLYSLSEDRYRKIGEAAMAMWPGDALQRLLHTPPSLESLDFSSSDRPYVGTMECLYTLLIEELEVMQGDLALLKGRWQTLYRRRRSWPTKTQSRREDLDGNIIAISAPSLASFLAAGGRDWRDLSCLDQHGVKVAEDREPELLEGLIRGSAVAFVIEALAVSQSPDLGDDDCTASVTSQGIYVVPRAALSTELFENLAAPLAAEAQATLTARRRARQLSGMSA